MREERERKRNGRLKKVMECEGGLELKGLRSTPSKLKGSDIHDLLRSTSPQPPPPPPPTSKASPRASRSRNLSLSSVSSQEQGAGK